MLWIAFQIIAAYLLVDLISGLYHWATDKGLNVADQIAMFREHHETNTMSGFDWQTFAVALPFVGLGAWCHSTFWIACGIFGALTQVTHYYAHKRSRNELVHHVVRILQLTWLIVPPEIHARHHREPFDSDFCLLSGWNNFWLNRVVLFFKPERD